MVAHSIIQQYRLMRLMMIIIIAGLTIFLYTSYYANQSIHQMPSAQRLQTIFSNSNSLIPSNREIQEQQSFSSGSSDSKSATNIIENSVGTKSGNIICISYFVLNRFHMKIFCFSF